jgi:YVTN family beta-propeller protein
VAVPDWVENQIEIIDVRARSAVKVLGVPHPHNCFNAHSDSAFVCSSMDMHALYRVDLKTMRFSAEYGVDEAPRPFAVTRDGQRAFVQVTGYHGIEETGPSPAAAPRRVDLPPAPISSCLSEGGPQTPSHGVALSPDETQLWVDSLADGMVYAYDTLHLSLQAKVPVGECPAWIDISSEGRYVAVSNSASDETSLIDRAGAREVARIKVGRAPKRLVFVDVK